MKSFFCVYNIDMYTLSLVIIFILLFIWVYLIAIFPKINRKHLMKPYEDVFIAHRGLFNNTDIPENSIKAFKKAVKNGYPIHMAAGRRKSSELCNDQQFFE